ncbi:MAG: hypothetical protein Q4G71_05500 [Pseudomonadota bacterium]|nr:hypothetical protein [Pseudomonadota bacterium]
MQGWPFLAACCFALIPTGVGAWGISEPTLYDLGQLQMTHRSLSRLNESVFGDAAATPAGGTRVARSPLDLGQAGLSVAGNGTLSSNKGIEKIVARLFPREEFVPRRIALQQLVEAFQRNAQQVYGVPPNHLATAMAVAVAGGWSAWHGEPFRDEWVKPLVAQFDAALRDDPAIAAMSIGSKVYTHQLLVGMGLLLLAEQAAQGAQYDAGRRSRLRKLGGDYFQSLLQVSPQQVQLSAQGLRMP